MTERVEQVLRLGISRETVEREIPDYLSFMQPLGAAWRRQLRDWGLPCPETFVELADAMGEVLVILRAWQLLDPERSSEDLKWIRDHQTEFASLVAYSGMAPLFGRDGDLLMLAADGSIHMWRHEGFEEDVLVAPDFDALLAAFLDDSEVLVPWRTFGRPR